MSLQDVVIVDALRTAFGAYQGTLTSVGADELAAPIITEMVRRTNVDPDIIDLCILGNVDNHSNAPNLGRLALLRAQFPHHIGGYSVEHQCGSGLASMNIAYMHIATGNSDVVLAGGAENLSGAPYWIEGGRQGFRLDEDGLKIHCEYMETARRVCGPELYKDRVNMGITAENLAEKYDIGRSEQDEYALRSQMRWADAQDRNRFSMEILPLEVETRKGPVVFDTDEHPRPGTTIEALSALRPVFKDGGTVTAGNSSGINDGGAGILLMSREKARELELAPKASIGKHCNVGVDPATMGIAAAYAIRKLLKMAGTKLEDYGLFEINEAFSAQILAVFKELGWNEKQIDLVNVNGGAIAMGHPVGATGARLVLTLVEEMHLRGVERGIVALCCGGGTGIATELILE